MIIILAVVIFIITSISFCCQLNFGNSTFIVTIFTSKTGLERVVENGARQQIWSDTIFTNLIEGRHYSNIIWTEVSNFLRISQICLLDNATCSGKFQLNFISFCVKRIHLKTASYLCSSASSSNILEHRALPRHLTHLRVNIQQFHGKLTRKSCVDATASLKLGSIFYKMTRCTTRQFACAVTTVHNSVIPCNKTK